MNAGSRVTVATSPSLATVSTGPGGLRDCVRVLLLEWVLYPLWVVFALCQVLADSAHLGASKSSAARKHGSISLLLGLSHSPLCAFPSLRGNGNQLATIP